METHGRCTDSGVIFALKWRVLYPYGMISEVQDCVHVGPFCLFVYVIYFLLVWACRLKTVCTAFICVFICILDGMFECEFVFGLRSSSAGLWNHPGLQHASGLSPAHRRGDRRHSSLHCPRPSNLTCMQRTILCHHCTQIYRWAANYVYLCILHSHLCVSTHRLSGKVDPFNDS